jgi:hypothetical protein
MVWSLLLLTQQLNLGNNSYHMKQFSYFEADGITEAIPVALF